MGSEPSRVADVPDQIVLKRDRDLEGRTKHVWIRRGLLVLLGALPVLGLLNLFGQRPVGQTVAAPAASLKVYAPTRVRGGDIFTARFHIYAHRELKKATLLLDPGWFEAMTFNGIAPQPVNEGSTDGWPTFEYGHIPAGKSLIAYMSIQVNPTNVGHRSAEVRLSDGNQHLLTVHRAFTIFP